MVSELTYKDLSADVYLLDSKHKNHVPLEVDEIGEFGSIEYQILKIVITATEIYRLCHLIYHRMTRILPPIAKLFTSLNLLYN